MHLGSDQAAKKAERSGAAKVLRRLALHLTTMGFKRKGRFFARPAGAVIHFIHVHKYSFGSAFRMHACIRVLNDPRPYLALLGIDHDDKGFDYNSDPTSIEQAASNMAEFVREVAEPWFKACSPLYLQSAASFLPPEDRLALEAALRGDADAAVEQRSRELLGL